VGVIPLPPPAPTPLHHGDSEPLKNEMSSWSVKKNFYQTLIRLFHTIATLSFVDMFCHTSFEALSYGKILIVLYQVLLNCSLVILCNLEYLLFGTAEASDFELNQLTCSYTREKNYNRRKQIGTQTFSVDPIDFSDRLS